MTKPLDNETISSVNRRFTSPSYSTLPTGKSCCLLQLSTWDGVLCQTIFKHNTPTITNKGMAVAWWVCTCNHNTQEAEAVQLLWVPGQPGINNKFFFFFLNKGNQWVNKREHRSLPHNLRIAREWDGLGTGAQIWSSKGMGTFCRGNQSRTELGELQRVAAPGLLGQERQWSSRKLACVSSQGGCVREMRVSCSQQSTCLHNPKTS